MQRGSPGTPRKCTLHPRQAYRRARHPRSASHPRPARSVPCTRPMEWWSAGFGRPEQRVEEWGTRASRTRKRGETGGGRLQSGGAWAAKTVRRTLQHPAQPRYANYWAPLTHKRHQPQPAQPQDTNDGAPRKCKQHQQKHRPQQLPKRNDPTQHAKGRTGDCPGPYKETAIRGNVTQGGGAGSSESVPRHVS